MRRPDRQGPVGANGNGAGADDGDGGERTGRANGDGTGNGHEGFQPTTSRRNRRDPGRLGAVDIGAGHAGDRDACNTGAGGIAAGDTGARVSGTRNA